MQGLQCRSERNHEKRAKLSQDETLRSKVGCEQESVFAEQDFDDESSTDTESDDTESDDTIDSDGSVEGSAVEKVEEHTKRSRNP